MLINLLWKKKNWNEIRVVVKGLEKESDRGLCVDQSYREKQQQKQLENERQKNH